MNPLFITGFVDAEGSFIISFQKVKWSKLGWGVRASFKIGVHLRDKALLEQIKSFFGVGNIYTSGLNVSYEVNSLRDLEVIIAHFGNYPLMTKKRSDYILFKSVVALLNRKENLIYEGLINILSIKASMNKGLSYIVKKSFPNIVPSVKPMFNDISIKDPHWLAGFTSGEGCFMVRIRNSSHVNNLPKVELIFQITQHKKDEILMKSFVDYLGCGLIRERKGGLAVDFLVYKTLDLNSKIIPFFEAYPILGVKYKEFQDFVSVIRLKNNSAHLTQIGIKQIKEIQSRMNTKRLD